MIKITRKSGAEKFLSARGDANVSVLEFWQWSASDLNNNSLRCILAEFLVARALEIDQNAVRVAWNAYDLDWHTPEYEKPVRIEVKSSAYVQSWAQKKLSTITFGIHAARCWDPETGMMEEIPRRPSHVYVFALLTGKDANSDPLNLDLWNFYVVPTRKIDDYERSQSSITLPSLEKFAAPVSFFELRNAIKAAYETHRVVESTS